MMAFIGKIVKKEANLHDVLAEYHPAEVDLSNPKKDTNQSAYEHQAASETDEMQIDRIYQSL